MQDGLDRHAMPAARRRVLEHGVSPDRTGWRIEAAVGAELDKVETIDGGEVLFPPYCQEGVRCAVCGVRSERGKDEGCGIRGADCAVYGVWCAV